MASRSKLAADAWGALLHVHAELVPALDKIVQHDAGLPLAWYDVLLELASAPNGRLRMSELAERVALSRSRVSRLVDELVSHGLIDKQDHPSDRRACYAVITDAGLAQFRAAAPVYLRAIVEQFAAGLTNDELARLAGMLGRVRGRPRAPSAGAGR